MAMKKLPHTDFQLLVLVTAVIKQSGPSVTMCLVDTTLLDCTHVCPFSPVVSFYPPVGYSSTLHGYYRESCPPGALVWKPGAEWWEVVLK